MSPSILATGLGSRIARQQDACSAQDICFQESRRPRPGWAARQGQAEASSSMNTVDGFKSTAMCFRNGAAYGQTDSHTLLLAGEEGFKDPFRARNTQPIVFYLDAYTSVITERADREFL